MSEQQTSLGAKRVEPTTLESPSATTTGQSTTDASIGAGRATGRRRSDRIISASAQMQEVVDHASAISRSDDLIVIAGASGTGRKHVARAIHQWSPRAGGALVEVQLAGATEPAQIRELFGEDGAAGAIARAEGGTLLLESADQLSGGALTRLADALRAAGGRVRVLATASLEGTSALAPLGGQRLAIAPLADRQ